MKMRGYVIRCKNGNRISYFYGTNPEDNLWHRTLAYERELATTFIGTKQALGFARRIAGSQGKKGLQVVPIIALIEEDM